VRDWFAALITQGDKVLALLLRTLEAEQRTSTLPLQRPPAFVVGTISRIEELSHEPEEKGEPRS
jgi:hypothetical protein